MSTNSIEEITEIYAFITEDEGVAQVLGMTTAIDGKNTYIPFICTNEILVERLRPYVIEIALNSKKKVKLIKFNNPKHLEEY